MKLKTVDIKGKSYVMVHERIRAFHELYPKGDIVTEIIADTGSEVTMRATVRPDYSIQRVFTGFAHEKNSGGLVNSTSHVENCETSAVGRALGFLGIGVETSIATAEEVDHAIKQQEAPAKLTFFTYNGKKYPHVSTIVHPDPLPIPEWHKEVGTELDLFMKAFFSKKGHAVNYDKFKGDALVNLKECIEAAESWLIDNGDSFKEFDLDVSVINHTDLYVGTDDIEGMYNNMPCIADFKKSKNIDNKLKDQYFMQMAAYSKGMRKDKKVRKPTEILVICSPFNDPMVSHEVDKYYAMFLEKRAEFKKRFGF